MPPDKTVANCSTDGSEDGPTNGEDREYVLLHFFLELTFPRVAQRAEEKGKQPSGSARRGNVRSSTGTLQASLVW